VNEVPLEVERLIAMVRGKKPGIEFDTEFFVTLPPAQDCSTSIIANRMRDTHMAVTGGKPEEGVGLFYSDASHLQAYGIPAVNYGPSGRTVTGKENWDPDVGEHLSIDDLTSTAKVYTSLILDVCSKTRDELGLKVLQTN
jgi:acetylornithine deacetylase/succinyl-diaminopimelate desuccinylase-like protein